ncbi:sugar phosphate nucleotidyltransferase [Cypionkella psychrotolerans]|uniref:sugar phosphate nucleotidyltransferase n=1 Tax=Cypionkella psychrotolerans TaxID=1678131 RepID=UPI0009EC938F|nr:sugar phosphate nucleotidyltransferase [Cypionkella psychrotolerans]
MDRGALAEMAEHYRYGHMIAAMTVPDHETSRYGIFAPGGSATEMCIPVGGMVEKPPLGTAPSSLAAVGRYILQPMIFDVLDHTPKGPGGELTVDRRHCSCDPIRAAERVPVFRHSIRLRVP